MKELVVEKENLKHNLKIINEIISKDKKIRTYKIIVNKLGCSEARLQNLMFEEGVVTPVFNKNIYDPVIKKECKSEKNN